MRYFAGWLFLAAMTSSALAVDNTVIVTPGTGVTMRSKDVGSGTESMMPIPGDTAGNALATAPGTPNGSFALPIQGVSSGVAVPISSSTLATKANQDTNSATTSHTCSTGGSSMIGCLGQIDDDVKGPVAAGTNVIGAVTIPGALYNTVAASQIAQALTGGSGGATGDYLSHCVLYPTALNTGVVTVFDGTASAANDVILFAGGSPSVSNLTPISVPVGAFSVNGAWKVTTGTAISVTCYGKFH